MSVIHTLLTAVALRHIDASSLVFTNLTLQCILEVRTSVVWPEQDNQLKKGLQSKNRIRKRDVATGLNLHGVGTLKIRGQFHQHFTNSFYARRSQKRKMTLLT